MRRRRNATTGDLGNYLDLKEEEGGRRRRCYAPRQPELTLAHYACSVIVQKVQFYPKPEPTDQLSQQTIDEIGNYLNASVRGRKICREGASGRHARARCRKYQMGHGAGVAPDKDGPQALYQYIPIALYHNVDQSRHSGTPEQAKIVVRAEATDSMTKEILLKVVRAGGGGGGVKRLRWKTLS